MSCGFTLVSYLLETGSIIYRWNVVRVSVFFWFVSVFFPVLFSYRCWISFGFFLKSGTEIIIEIMEDSYFY